MFQLFKDRNFLVFWVGNFISAVGDHVSIIAFPWLVLTLTGSPALMGLVFATQGLPRAVFMLTGGVLVDKSSPRQVMMVCNLVRLVIVLILAVLLLYGMATVMHVFLFAFAFGLADAFYFPAANAVLPSVLPASQLKDGNGLVQISYQISIVFGPLIAGLLIAGEFSLDTVHGVSEETVTKTDDTFGGIANALIFDAVTFFVSCISLLFTKARSLRDPEPTGQSVVQSLKEGVAFVWQTPALRLIFIGTIGLDFFFLAPVFVGLPVLAQDRFEEGALIYALELMAYGAGALIGGVLAVLTRGPKPEKLIRIAFALWAFSGLTVASVVLFYSVVPPMILFFIAGIGDNWVWVFIVTWIQTITPEKLMGRVMSILMFLSVGLVPVANLVVGLMLEWWIEAVFVIAGLSIFAICLICMVHPDAKRVTALTEKAV
ncbi:MFS transporter [Kordiimonas sediminis]|uniref:MFS transporter n=1 Tax=Kordiimonas sediminis TaxID=1735581 RepID=A0A919AMG8_9PROT|nr:MFS transporter [Kordiimonas sediminis]GHF14332.1 MFS transporter [Kordiimonas sediminis]